MWKKKLSNTYFSFQNIKETNTTFASAKSSSHLKKNPNCTKTNQKSQDKKTEYCGNCLIMRDLLFRVFENLQSIFIEQQFLRGQFIGGKKKRDSKEATEGKTDFKMETKHYSVLAKLINKQNIKRNEGFF